MLSDPTFLLVPLHSSASDHGRSVSGIQSSRPQSCCVSRLGSTLDFTSGYARAPLVVPSSDGTQRFALVSNEAFVNVGAAVTYDRYRLYLNLPMPYLVAGRSGIFGPLQLNAPAVTPGTNPDTVADTQLGFDARLHGEPSSLLRFGASAQLIFP